MDAIKEVNVSLARLRYLGDRWVDWNDELGAGPRGIWELVMTGEPMELPPRLWVGADSYQCRLAIPMTFAFTGGFCNNVSDKPQWPFDSLGLVTSPQSEKQSKE